MAGRRLAVVVGQLQRGGAERQLFELVTRLDRSLYDPLVICLSEVVDPYAGRLSEAGVEVIVAPRAGHRDLSRVRALASILSGRRIDLAHSFLLAANAYTWAATRLSGRRPYIASSRTCMPPRGRFAAWVHRRAFAGASAVIANAGAVMAFTSDLYGLPAERITVIPNGVDLRPFDAAAADRERRREAVRSRLGLARDAVVAGAVGRLSPEKNFPLLVEAARRVRRESGTPVHVVVAGDGPERDRLAASIRRSGLGGTVTLAGASDDVPTLMTCFDLFAQTSETEGLPNAVMEAMAASLPVAATRVGGTAELVDDGASGLLVPPGDAEAMAGAIDRLARDPSMRARLGRRGRERIEADFTVERMVDRTVALYDRVPA